jgi:hypothetical protein
MWASRPVRAAVGTPLDSATLVPRAPRRVLRWASDIAVECVSERARPAGQEATGTAQTCRNVRGVYAQGVVLRFATMVVKKSVHPRPPPVHPALEQKIREAEAAEARGETPRSTQEAQRILRPSLDAKDIERAEQARAVGLVEPAYREGVDGRAAIAEQPAFLPGVDLDRVWDGLSEAEKLRAGATERFRLEIEATLAQAMMAHQPPHRIGGRLDARNLRRFEENLRHELDAIDYLLAPDVRRLLDRFVHDTRTLIDDCLRQRAVQGIEATSMYEILRDLVRKVLYQEIINKRRQLGERGARRVLGGIELADELLVAMQRLPGASIRDRLVVRIIQVHQDLGHTAYAARVSFRGAKLHRAYGARIFNDELNRYRALLHHDELELARTAVASHSAEELPLAHERLLAVVRAVDHLTPFMRPRVYMHLAELPGATAYLDDMLGRARKRDVAAYAAARLAFRAFLGGADLPPPLRDDLFAALRPIEREAELVEVGALAGVVTSLEVDARGAGVVRANLRRDAFAEKYQALFDLQQEQLVRLARNTGVPAALLAAGQTVRFEKPGFAALELVPA